MIQISDIDDDRIRHYRSLHATPVLHTRDRVFIAEGDKTVRALLRSPLAVRSMFALPSYYERLAPLIAARALPPETLLTADRAVMDAIVGFRLHQGVMAMAHQPREPELRELVPPVAVLDGIVDSENVGAIVRSCVAFGVRSIVVCGGGSSPYLRRAVRASMGAVCHIAVHMADDTAYTLDELRRQYGYAVVVLEQRADAIPLAAFAFPPRSAVVFGSEGHGVSAEALAAADHLVTIPHSADVDSLNVAAAAAVTLYTLSGSFSHTDG